MKKRYWKIRAKLAESEEDIAFAEVELLRKENDTLRDQLGEALVRENNLIAKLEELEDEPSPGFLSDCL